MHRSKYSSIAIVVAITVLGCRGGQTPKATDEPIDKPGLHNVHRVMDNLYSGSSPEGDEGFQSLASLGIRTIISVDGARPDVERARRFDMQYVHLPIGYDSVPREQALRIARVVRERPGTVYLHCHHGKHRGPAAAVAARRCLDGNCTATEALEFLRLAGTDPRYAGLFQSVDETRPADAAEWDKVPAEFPAIAETSGLVQAMVRIDNHWDHLKAVRTAKWSKPADHADLDPAHEALQLLEQFRESVRLPAVTSGAASQARLMRDAESTASDLEAALRAKKFDDADKAFIRMQKLCGTCHEQFRDVRPQR